MSNSPWVEWRLSFSVVEKEIFVNLPWLFRKVYLLCKTVAAEWKEKYKFPSYILKTIFLCKYESWQKTNKEYTENDLLTMMLDVFVYLLKCYENQNVPMYFIPEQNLLELYSKTKITELLNYLREDSLQHGYAVINRDLIGESEKNLVVKLKEIINIRSLADFVFEKFKFPFGPIVQSFKSKNQCKVINAGEKPSRINLDIIRSPSYHDLFFLYSTKILQNKGSFNKEHSSEILSEIYVTFLFIIERIIRPGLFATDPLEHSLYFLRVFGNDYFASESMTGSLIAEYCDSTNRFFSENNRLPNFDQYELPYHRLVENNVENIRKSLSKDFDREELPKMWLNGYFDDHKISLKYRLNLQGNREKSENLQKTIEKNIFWTADSDFNQLLEKINENFSPNFFDRCLKEVMAEKEAKDNYDGISFILSSLVDHMSEMHKYGFTAGKFNLPTPAVFISYLSQYFLNVQIVNGTNDRNDQNRPSFSNRNVSNLLANSLNETTGTNDNAKNKWGFTVKKGESYNYVTYDRCKYTTIPFRLTLMEMKYNFT